MLFDHFQSVGKYRGVPFLKEIREFVSSRDCAKLPDGEIEIQGRDLFVRIAQYETGAADQKQFEAHTVYADLQLIAAGKEVMEVSIERGVKAVTQYRVDEDICFFEEPKEKSSFLVTAGQFTVFFPGELHKPGCHAGTQPGRIKKLVFKIRFPAS